MAINRAAQRERSRNSSAYSWATGRYAPCVADDEHLYSGARGAGYYNTFALALTANLSSDGTSLIGATATGYLPVNQPGSSGSSSALEPQGETFSPTG